MKLSLPAYSFASMNPIHLGTLILVITVITIIIWGHFSSDETIEWFIATSGLCLYAWMVTSFSFFNKSWSKYTIQAIICYLVIGFVSLSTAHFVSTTYIDELIEYQMLILAITIFFGVSIVMSKVIQGTSTFLREHWFYSNIFLLYVCCVANRVLVNLALQYAFSCVHPSTHPTLRNVCEINL